MGPIAYTSPAPHVLTCERGRIGGRASSSYTSWIRGVARPEIRFRRRPLGALSGPPDDPFLLPLRAVCPGFRRSDIERACAAVSARPVVPAPGQNGPGEPLAIGIGNRERHVAVIPRLRHGH